jgi:hypothetical protein
LPQEHGITLEEVRAILDQHPIENRVKVLSSSISLVLHAGREVLFFD